MFIQSGLNDFLAKPIEMLRLDDILTRWIPAEKQQRDLTGQVIVETPLFFIEGVDVNSGIIMTGGRLTEYITTLEVFCKDVRDRVPEIQKCLEVLDISLYTTYVHSLKSASRSIGAKKISESSRILEDAGRSGDSNFIEKFNPVFITGLEELTGNIETALAAMRQDLTQPDQDTEAEQDTELRKQNMATLAVNLNQLKRELGTMNIGLANELISSLQLEKWGKDIDNLILQISRQVLLFDYEEAARSINSLLKDIVYPAAM
jgi:HPt (histidine-containing phosphotransfer) domain-containing protein